MKAVVDVDNDSILGILGFAMLGAQAGEVIAVVQTAMWAALPYPVFRAGIIAHQRSPKGSTCCSQKSRPNDC